MNDTTTSIPTIQSSAMLIDITIGVWSAFKLDRKTSEEVNTDKHADVGSARVNKNLLKGVKELEAIKSFASATRKWLYANTLPWSDSGPRLLPTGAFFNFKQELNKREQDFDTLVLNFVHMYPTLISNQAFKLGNLFNRAEYPTPVQVQNKFYFTAAFSPLPQSGDFRLDIGNEALEALQEEYNETYTARFDAAMSDIKQRLIDGVKHLSERLEYDGEGKMKVFRDSALENVATMLQQVHALNITKDEALQAAAENVNELLGDVNVKALRKDNDVRDETKEKLDDILAKFAL